MSVGFSHCSHLRYHCFKEMKQCHEWNWRWWISSPHPQPFHFTVFCTCYWQPGRLLAPLDIEQKPRWHEENNLTSQGRLGTVYRSQVCNLAVIGGEGQEGKSRQGLHAMHEKLFHTMTWPCPSVLNGKCFQSQPVCFVEHYGGAFHCQMCFCFPEVLFRGIYQRFRDH